MSDSLVIIPTFNEIENIEKMVHKVFALEKDFDLLIVDDGSPDGTGQKVKDLQQQYPEKLHLIERTGKQGLGTAYITGFKFALEKDYAFIFEMDCDFSHNPDDLIRLYKACKEDGFDMSVGSRYVPGGNVANWPWDRVAISKVASAYVQMVTWMGIRDTTAGFVCYTNKVLDAINFDKIRFIGYAFQIEMKFAAKKLGFNIAEVPITFIDRQEGTSKMSKGIIKEAVFGVLQMQMRSFFGNYR